MDFVWIPNIAPFDQQWNSNGARLNLNYGDLEPDDTSGFKTFHDFNQFTGWSYGGGNIVPTLVADPTDTLGKNLAYYIGVGSKEAFDDIAYHNKSLHEDEKIWEYFLQYGEAIADDGLNMVKKRSNVYTIPNVYNPDENLETTHGAGEFYVFHPLAGSKNQGAWINLPHLSWYHLSRYYFEKDEDKRDENSIFGTIANIKSEDPEIIAQEITNISDLQGNWQYYDVWGWTQPHPKNDYIYDSWRQCPPGHSLVHPEYSERW